MRIYVFDPGLTEFGGHHDHMGIHLRPSFERYGAEVRIFANRRASAELLAACKATPLFTYGHYQKLSGDPYDGVLVNVLAGAQGFAKDLKSLGDDAPTDADIVFMPTASPREMLGLASWMRSSKRRPRVAMLLHDVFPTPMIMSKDGSFTEGSLGGGLYRYVGNIMARTMNRNRWLIGATTQPLADLLSPLLRMDMKVFPVPVWYNALPSIGEVKPETGSNAPLVTVMAHLHPATGYEKIPPIVRALHARGLQIRTTIHVLAAGQKTGPDMQPYHALETDGLAEILDGWLTDDDLNSLIARSSLLVQPYHRERYRNTISGLFGLATAMARPCVVPSDTWMAQQISNGKAAGFSYGPGETDVITDAVARAIESLPQLQHKAMQAAVAWREKESGDALIDRVMTWAGVSRQG